MTTHHKTITRRTLAAAVGLLLTVWLASPVWAQPVDDPAGPFEEEPPPPSHLTALKLQQRPPKPPRPKALRQRLFLWQQVGLSEARADKADRIMSRFAPEQRALRQKIRRTEERLRQLVGSDSNDDGAYKNALAELQEARKQLQALRDRELQALSQELTSKEQAKLVLALGQRKRGPGARRGQRGGPQLLPGNQRGQRRGPALRRGQRGRGQWGQRRMGRQGRRQLGPAEGQPPPAEWQPPPPQPELAPWQG